MVYRRGSLPLKDGEIYYEVMGQGPGLIFIHGLGGNHLSWWQQVPFFSRRYTCVTYSQRGFASSPTYSNKIETSVFSDDLAALIDHLEMKDVCLVAQSMGGWTCLEYAMRENNKARSLVMASTTGAINYHLIDHPGIKTLSEWTARSKDISDALDQRGILRSTGARMVEENPGLYYLYCQIFDQTPAHYREAVRRRIKEQRIVPPASLSALTIPTLFITGAEDVIFPSAAASAVASVMPSSRFACVPDAGHSVYFERAHVFNTMIEKFLGTGEGLL